MAAGLPRAAECSAVEMPQVLRNTGRKRIGSGCGPAGAQAWVAVSGVVAGAAMHHVDYSDSQGHRSAHPRTGDGAAASRLRVLTTNVPETGVRDRVQREVSGVLRCRERGVGQVRSLTVSLSALPALNAGVFEAAISMLSPVLGLRPCRAARVLAVKLPKPAMETCSPRASASAMAAKTALTARFAVAPGMAVSAATRDDRSALFMAFPLSRCARDWAVYAASNQRAAS